MCEIFGNSHTITEMTTEPDRNQGLVFGKSQTCGGVKPVKYLLTDKKS